MADNFKTNMDTTFTLMIVQAIIGVSGVFLLGFGIAATVFLNLVGLILGLLMPLLNSPTKQLHLLPVASPEIADHHEEAKINEEAKITG